LKVRTLLPAVKRKPPPPRRQVTIESTTNHLDPAIDEASVDAPVDADEEEPETGPLRRCVVTRERLPKARMFRFVVSPDRVLIPDLAGKLPGRGIWLSASRDVIEGGGETRPDGISRGEPSPRGKPAGPKGRDLANRELVRAIARAARGQVQVPPDLPVVLETALVRRIGDFTGLARRAGQAISGFEKARDWMRNHPVGLVLQASDGSEAERARFRSAVPDTVPVHTPLTGAELGRIFGHDVVVHVVVASGRLAEAIATDAERLFGLRTTPSPGTGVSAGLTGRETAEINHATGTNG
jgi:ribosomal protein L7Ae-like RNA K-turn-binding protein